MSYMFAKVPTIKVHFLEIIVDTEYATLAFSQMNNAIC